MNDSLCIDIISRSEEETIQFGLSLSKHLRSGYVVYLLGDLGLGKTTLVKGMLRGFGYSGIVKSPTYCIVESYYVKHLVFHHFDLYRLTSEDEFFYLGAEEYFDDCSICFIEWPSKAAEAIPKADVMCHISFLKDVGERRILVEG